MKRILLGIGILLCLMGVIPMLQYIVDYEKLSDYGKGFIWGKTFLVLAGIALMVTSQWKRKVGITLVARLLRTIAIGRMPIK